MITSIKVNENLFIVQQVINKSAPAKPVEVPTNHVVVIDCSGSMHGELPKIREQLKARLPKLLSEKDTLSIVWFSGKGEFGVLVEAEPVATLKDLQGVNKAIDRWLKSVGLTGFKEPLLEVADLIVRVGKKRPGSVFSLFFMSDGFDNVWPRPDVLKAVEKAAGGLAAATFIEYGYYSDRPLLTKMAEICGGNLIFAEDFDKYEPAFNAAMQKRPTGAPKVEVKVQGDPLEQFVWASDGHDLTTYGVEAGTARVPQDTSTIFWLSATAVGKVDSILPDMASNEVTRVVDKAFETAYAAVSLFSVRMKPKVVLPILKALGDVQLVEAFGGLFGKQSYSTFMDEAKAASFDPKLRYLKGYDPKRIPRDDAFTVLELLDLLAASEGNRVLLEHGKFSYSKISRGRLDSSENLTADELDAIQTLTARIASERDVKKIKEIQAEIAAIVDSKKPALKFELDAKEAAAGYPLHSLTFNEEKPNASVLVRKAGTVDVSSRLPDALKGRIPGVFPTFVFRNYAMVKDGLVNVKILPVALSAETISAINARMKDGSAPAGLVETGADGVTLLNLGIIPTINQNMVGDVKAEDFMLRQWELMKAQADQKVYNALHKEHIPGVKVKGYAELYGEDGAAWLKEQGFSEHNGFSPKSVQAESKDVYKAREMSVALKGYSKLPSMKELDAMIAKGKVNPPGELMLPARRAFEEFMAGPAYVKAAAKEKVLEAWLDGNMKDARKRTRKLIYEIARTTFAIIVGQTWFANKTLDNTEFTIDVDGKTVQGAVKINEVEVPI